MYIMCSEIINFRNSECSNKITKAEVVNYIVKKEAEALNTLNLTKEDIATLDGDKVTLSVNDEIRVYTSFCVVADKDSGMLKVGTKEDMYNYFNVSYNAYNEKYKLTQGVGFKENRNALMLVELPNCQAMVNAMWGTHDWICKLIKGIRS